MSDQGYEGPAELITETGVTPVAVRLRGHFEPISGKYRWFGRVDATPEVAALLAAGVRDIRLRTPHAEVATRISDVDPWGRPRVEGFGAAPFEVITSVSR